MPLGLSVDELGFLMVQLLKLRPSDNLERNVIDQIDDSASSIPFKNPDVGILYVSLQPYNSELYQTAHDWTSQKQTRDQVRCRRLAD